MALIKSNGNNQFTNNVFSWEAWSADVLQKPEEVCAVFDQLNLTGKKIVDIKPVGYGYNFLCDYVSELSEDKPCYRHVEVDEPLFIVFADGDRMEIEFSEGSSIRISKNCIPLNIESGLQPPNYDAKQLFSNCVGQLLTGLEVKVINRSPGCTGSHGIELNNRQRKFIEAVSLVFSNSTKLYFEPFADYGWITAVDKNDTPLEISLDAFKALIVR